MLGQIVYCGKERRKPRLEREYIAGMPVCRAYLDPEGFWATRRLKKTARLLAREGIVRVLVPESFEGWEQLGRYGLRGVDPLPFLRAHAAPLVLASLRRQGSVPEKSAVALRGLRADRDLIRAAQLLCPRVRDLCISAPRGGEALEKQLRWEYGVALRPDFLHVSAAVRFDEQTSAEGEHVLDLFPPSASLRGVEVNLPGLELCGGERLPVLAALWESGKVGREQLEFT